jgi:hypothetical protein
LESPFFETFIKGVRLMKTLTGMGGIGGAQELAELLRQMGRGPDSMLAHITPEEAQMLLESGGSGTTNPMTGLPEFVPIADNDYRSQILASESPDYYGTSQTGFNQALEAAEQFFPEQMTQRQQYDLPQVLGDNLVGGFEYTGGQNLQRFQRDFGPQYTPSGEFVGMTRLPTESPAETMRLQEYAQGLRRPQEVQPGVLDQLTSGIGDRLRGLESGYGEFRKEYPMLERLLSTGAASLPAILQARRSRRETGSAAEELRRLGQPLREQGEALRQQALSGGLTPQQARQQEARRASLRQSASQRGSTTGTQQAMIENTLARERAGLAEVNLNNAIKQLNLANAYDEAAIRAKLQGDRETGDILASIMGDLVRSATGQPRGGQQQGGGQQPRQPLLPQENITQRLGERR